MSSSWFASCKFTLGAGAVFLGLSVADFFLTWQLIDASPGEISESNPLAAHVLDGYGWHALAAYKSVIVLLIGALVWQIHRRRPRVAELVTVFGCGALAAVVLTSYFHLRCAEPGPVCEIIHPAPCESVESLPTGSLSVIGRESVQAELNLTEEQVADAKEIDRLRRELRHRMKFGKLESCKLVLQMLMTMEGRLAGDLTPKQIQRLRQLTWQNRGYLALADLDVVEALRLTDAQIDEISNLMDPPTPSEFGIFFTRKVATNEGNAELKRQLAAVLTPDQRARWRALQGEPFAFGPRGSNPDAHLAEE